MRPSPLVAVVVAVASLAFPLHAAAEGRRTGTIVACAPGYPGTTAEAQPSMDAFAAAVARVAGLPAGALAATYEPTEQGGLARLGRPDAAIALVTLPFFLKHAGRLGLTARLQVATQDAGPTEVWMLVAKKGRVARPQDLAGFTVVSIAGYAPEFVRGAPGAWGRIPESARIEQSTQVLTALRRAANGENVAVLLDGVQSKALPSLPFAGEVEVVARSAPFPTALVATVGKRLSPARWAEVEKALLHLSSDPQGAAALEGIRMAGFEKLDPAALGTARRLVAESTR